MGNIQRCTILCMCLCTGITIQKSGALNRYEHLNIFKVMEDLVKFSEIVNLGYYINVHKVPSEI